MTDKEIDWKEHFASCKDGDDFVKLFRKIGSNKRARNEYLNYLKRRGDMQALDSIGQFKKKRYERRKEIQRNNQELDDKYKQTRLDE